MTAYVLDASLAAAWFLPDEASDAADRLLGDALADAPVVPSLFRHELRNLLLVAERRGRLAAADVDEALIRLAALPIAVRDGGDDRQVVNLARKYALTAYDAAYLELALREGAPLATLDKRLAEAARAEKARLIGPLAP